MKNLLLMIVAVSGYYIYSNFYAAVQTDFNPKDSRELFERVNNGQEVSANAVIAASATFAKKLCDDASYQAAGGHSVGSCHQKLESFHSMCGERIFDDKSKVFSNKEIVASLLKRFVNCVGT